MIKAILFDLDGVLIKTELETFRFYQDYLQKHHNIELPDSDFKYKYGRKSKDFFHDVFTEEQRKMIDIEKLTGIKRELFDKEIDRFVSKAEGVHELLQWLRSQKYKLALCSQNERPMIDRVINWLDVSQYFDFTLSLQDITEKKPKPEIYIKGAEKLGIKPDQCLVIEDSQDGVRAAKNAGMICIGVAHNYTPEGYLDEADHIVHSLMEITDVLSRMN